MDPTDPPPGTRPGEVTLMAAGELRTALAAHQDGNTPAAVAALMSIDTDSWQAIEQRLTALGGNLAALVSAVREAQR